MAKDGPETGQHSISSFFRPHQSAKSSRTSEVLVIDDSDDDDESNSARQSPPPKRVKAEPGSSAQPVATVSGFFRPRTSVNGPPASAASTSRISPSAKVARWRFNPGAEGLGTSEPADASHEEQARRTAFATKLLGRNLLERKQAYLQEAHYMEASNNDIEVSAASITNGAGSKGSELEDPSDVEDESEDHVVAKKTAKGNLVASEGDDGGAASTSQFAKYAARGTQAKAGATSANQPKFTPLEKQVLALKEANPGVLLAVEVGYKYRFYEEDARAASRVLNIAHFVKGNLVTASVPTHRLSIHIKRLINAGYKVGVVRQKETAALKKISDNRSKPFTRALDGLYTPATYIDELVIDPTGGVTSLAPTMMCIVEEATGKNQAVSIGLVAVVPSTGEVIYDQFDDSLMRSELETRMLHLQPSELILQEHLSKETDSIVRYLIGQHDAGVPGFQCRVDRFKKTLSSSSASSLVSDFLARNAQGPKSDLLKEIVIDDSDDEMSEDPSASSLAAEPGLALDLPKLALVALAAMMQHLQAFSLERVLSHASTFNHFSARSTMCVNGNTLVNLEVLVNSTDFRQSGSLLSVLDHCKTPMGKRRLRRWIARPLVSIKDVNERLDAVTEIVKNASAASLTLSKLRDILKGLPDLERGLVRIHLGKATPVELARVLETFQRIANVFQHISEDEEGSAGVKTATSVLHSPLLKAIVASLPAIRADVERHLNNINTHRARENKKDEMFREVSEEVQDCRDCIDSIDYEISELLSVYRKLLKRPRLEFIKVAEEEYLIEMRIADAKKLAPPNWPKVNSTKTLYRFRPPEVQAKLDELNQNRERLAAAADKAYQEYLRKVSESYEVFRAVVSQLATADCLFSFAITALSPGYVRPTFSSEPGLIDIVNGRHPIIEVTSPNPFVPNSVKLGGDGSKQMILTGLNMGGKSSFSRSVALIALMSQIGCYVPADSCTTSLFDTILTRMGASDEIARGRSTFMVEMSETSEILKMATSRSLVILDELGRGTSTSDGQAIASAVLQHMATSLRATTIFVTHYPSMAEVARRFPETVSVHHMSCIEEPRSDGFVDVTFLYKLAPGLASKSHGINVARLAELPERVLEVALSKSRAMEEVFEKRVKSRKAERCAEILRLIAARSTSDDRKSAIDKCMSALP